MIYIIAAYDLSPSKTVATIVCLSSDYAAMLRCFNFPTGESFDYDVFVGANFWQFDSQILFNECSANRDPTSIKIEF